MSKRYASFITALFCGFLGLFMVLNLLTPDRAFSPEENRYLKERPALSLRDFRHLDGAFFSGSYMKDYETYVTDQFVGRDGWISAKAMLERATGKQENNGIYIGSKDTLIARLPEPDGALVAKNIGYVNALTEQAGVPVSFSLIPGKSSVWANRLPKNAPNADEQAIIANAKEAVKADWVDVNRALYDHADQEIYYRLDHHWTSLGAYYGYSAFLESIGRTPVPLEAYEKTTVTEDFNGTTFSSSGVRWMAPDRIDLYVPEDGISVQSWFTAQPVEGQLYDRTKLAEKDKYALFMGGNQSLAVVKTPAAGDEKLLVVRDSYADSMVPFLTADFAEIHLFDPRYNKTPLSQYIRDNGIDRVLVEYSVANFITDGNLFVLGK